MTSEKDLNVTLNKDFAVVFFKSENIYSEIPVSWLTSDKNQCWWPNILNPRSRMTRGDKPNGDDSITWTLHEIKFESYASTLKSARKRAENPDYSTGNEELILGPRQRISKNQESSSSSSETLTPPPTPHRLPKSKKKASTKSVKMVQSKLNKISCSPQSIEVSTGATSEDLAQSCTRPSSITIETAEVDLGDGDILTKNISDIPIIISKENTTMADLHHEIQELKIVCNNIQNYIVSIDKRLKALTLEKGNLEVNSELETLLSRLPCKTNEDVKALDEELSNNEELKKTFIKYIKRIGGKDVKDNVNRCLPYLFTNALGIHCSYVGFRGNFKLQDFHFMKLFVEIVMLQHQSTLHDVEKCIGEWFRLSNQREKRQRK